MNRILVKLMEIFSFQIWFMRIAMLMKLKLFQEAELELKQFENFNKKYFFYESQIKFYPERKGIQIAPWHQSNYVRILFENDSY